MRGDLREAGQDMLGIVSNRANGGIHVPLPIAPLGYRGSHTCEGLIEQKYCSIMSNNCPRKPQQLVVGADLCHVVEII